MSSELDDGHSLLETDAVNCGMNEDFPWQGMLAKIRFYIQFFLHRSNDSWFKCISLLSRDL